MRRGRHRHMRNPSPLRTCRLYGSWEGRKTERAPVHGRPPGGISQSGYPQAVWIRAPMLWRTPPNLCTTRWTGL
ncbi:hypothetical protein STXM2123_4684 [Streptomyces sp. F-3]|nr:hypothetical protein STXM2123_4684 [Streptomyces sp. F-3]